MASTTTPTVLGTLYKGPGETRTFYMDWSAHLGTQSIVSSEWSVPTGLISEATSVLTGNTKTSITLSAGSARTTYSLTNTITTTTGDIYERTGNLSVRGQ